MLSFNLCTGHCKRWTVVQLYEDLILPRTIVVSNRNILSVVYTVKGACTARRQIILARNRHATASLCDRPRGGGRGFAAKRHIQKKHKTNRQHLNPINGDSFLYKIYRVHHYQRRWWGVTMLDLTLLSANKAVSCVSVLRNPTTYVERLRYTWQGKNSAKTARLDV